MTREGEAWPDGFSGCGAERDGSQQVVEVTEDGGALFGGSEGGVLGREALSGIVVLAGEKLVEAV